MNIACASQEVVFSLPGGSGEDSAFIARTFTDVLRHFAAPTTQVRRANAVAATLGETYEVLRRIKVGAVKAEATSVLRGLSAALLRFDLTSAPPMSAVALEDGSFVIEWVFADRRLGFSFDPQPGKSGWFFVSSQDSGSVRAHGRVPGTEVDFLLAWVLQQGPMR